MTVTAATKPASIAFPKAAVEARLRSDLLKSVAVDASLKSIPWPASAAAQSATSIQIDSLVVVSLLCAVEPLLGFELQDSIVKQGGYTSVNHAVELLMPRIEKVWAKNGPKGNTK